MNKLLILSICLVSLTACNLSYRDPEQSWLTPIIEDMNNWAASSDSKTAQRLSSVTPMAAGFSCSPRVDWPVHIVARGDTLSGIAVRSNSTVAELAAANCMDNPNFVVEGQKIYVPQTPVSPTNEAHP